MGSQDGAPYTLQRASDVKRHAALASWSMVFP